MMDMERGEARQLYRARVTESVRVSQTNIPEYTLSVCFHSASAAAVRRELRKPINIVRRKRNARSKKRKLPLEREQTASRQSSPVLSYVIPKLCKSLRQKV